MGLIKLLSSGPVQGDSSPLNGFQLSSLARPLTQYSLGLLAGASTVLVFPGGALTNPGNPEITANDIPTTLSERSKQTTNIKPLLTNPNIDIGPFQNGMKTAFANVPIIDHEIANLMNVHYDTLRKQGFTENCAVVFTLHMVKESSGGLSLLEESNGNGVVTVQFSHWDGKGTGRELSWLKNPKTGTGWKREDLLPSKTLTRHEAVENSALAIGALLRNYPHYKNILTACYDTNKSITDLADITTKQFIRQGESNSTRIKGIIQSYADNEFLLKENIAQLQGKQPNQVIVGDPLLPKRNVPTLLPVLKR